MGENKIVGSEPGIANAGAAGSQHIPDARQLVTIDLPAAQPRYYVGSAGSVLRGGGVVIKPHPVLVYMEKPTDGGGEGSRESNGAM
jgi:hypothetical protein